jgi:hypothetical protein
MDNSCFHTAQASGQKLEHYGFEQMSHTRSFADFVNLIFFSFGCIKSRLVDKDYETEDVLLAQREKCSRVNFLRCPNQNFPGMN